MIFVGRRPYDASRGQHGRKESKKPFFARYLENQQLEAVTGGKPPKQTLKYPSDIDEDQTMKYPSDDDEAGEPI